MIGLGDRVMVPQGLVLEPDWHIAGIGDMDNWMVTGCPVPLVSLATMVAVVVEPAIMAALVGFADNV